MDTKRVALSISLTLVMALPALAQVGSGEGGSAAKGRLLYDQYKCGLCHQLEGKGGKLSVALDGVADRRTADAMKRILINPAKELADSKAKVKMPVLPFKEGEVDTLVAFLQTLKKPK
jgi:cytochrome c2